MAESRKAPPAPPGSRLNSTVSGSRAGSSGARHGERREQLHRTLSCDHGAAPERDCDLKLEYNKLLQSIFMECMLDETISKEKTEVDLQLTELAKRCEMNVNLLDKTNKRLREIKFLAEQQRILDMKNDDCSKFYANADTTRAESILKDLTSKQQSYLDRIETKNVDLGYDERNGHKQLSEALEDAIQGFESIKQQSKLDPEKLREFGTMRSGLEGVQKDLLDLDNLKKEFEAKFPELRDRTLIQSSAELARMMERELGLGESDDE